MKLYRSDETRANLVVAVAMAENGGDVDRQDDSRPNDGENAHSCLTDGCGKPAKLQCPTCLKLEIDSSWFCSQDCFKSFWPIHKKVHQAKRLVDGIHQAANAAPVWAQHYSFTGSIRPAVVTERRNVPARIDRPDYAYHPSGVAVSEREARGKPVKVLDEDEIAGVRLASKLARECLDEAAAACDTGVTTDELDRIVHEAALERECYPSPLGYYGFPKSCCTSVNEVICHGIPDTRPLQDGDICNVDVTVYHRGFHGDLNETFLVGKGVDEASVRLVKTAHECLYRAIDIVRPGVKFREIGNVIQKHAQAAGCSVVRTYCGHGIHRLFHTAPNVPHYAKSKAMGVMAAGNVFTIEPMINAGNWHDTKWPDDWTAVTTDGKRSAQFEQTLLVTETGCEILTGRREHDGRPWFVDAALKHGYPADAASLQVDTGNVRKPT